MKHRLEDKIIELQKENKELSEQLAMWVNPEIPTEMERLKKENEELKGRVAQLQERNDYMTGELEDVVSELYLSESMIEKHGQLGTKPSILVNIILSEKDLMINSLKHGLKELKERSNEK